MRKESPPVAHESASRGPRAVRLAVIAMVLRLALPAGASAQSLTDFARLAGADPVMAVVEVAWDDLITTSAGGATGDQFHQAMVWGFEEALASAGPSLVEDAPVQVVCRVETVFDGGVVAYSARVELRRVPADAGAPVITWFDSWVGTTGVQGLHQMFTLGQRCAKVFSDSWRLANPG